MENLIVDGTFSGAWSNWYIVDSGAQHIRIINCEAHNAAASGFLIGRGYDIVLIDCVSSASTLYGFRVYFSSSSVQGTFINCIAYDNTRNGFQLGGEISSVAIGCVAYGNGGTTYSGFLVIGASGHASGCYNCVSYNNGLHGFELNNASAFAINCIASGNGPASGSSYGFFNVAANGTWSVPVVMNCCAYDNSNNASPGTQNYSLVLPERDSIEVDPLFVDAAGDDFRLLPGSPCLNTGKRTLGDGYASMGAWQQKQRGSIIGAQNV